MERQGIEYEIARRRATEQGVCREMAHRTDEHYRSVHEVMT